MRIAVLVADSLRADSPGFAGGPCLTPTLDRLAAESRVFRRCFSAAPWTVPSIAAMLTGVFATRLGLYRWDQPLPQDFPSLFDVAANCGYQVASFVFDTGFLFSSMPEAKVVGSSQEADDVIRWIETCPHKNLLVFVHYWGTHFPYIDKPMSASAWAHVSTRLIEVMNAEPGTAKEKARALQSRAIERMSENFLPRLLGAIGRHEGPDGSAMVMTADHGESWGEEGGQLRDVFDLHGRHLRDDVLAVPLLVWAPGKVAPGIVDSIVRTVDLAPTIASLMGDDEAFETEGALGIDGRSLLGEVEDRVAIAARSADFLSPGTGTPSGPEELWEELSLRTRRWKQLWTPGTGEKKAYALEVEPGERAPEEGWARLQREWERARCAPPADPVETRLRKLGYLS